MLVMFLFVQGDFGKDEDSKRRRLSKRRSSSSLLAKSAPPTPQGERLLQPVAAAAPAGAAAQRAQPPPRSPGRSFGRHNGQALKQLSISTPAMTQAQALARPQASSAEPMVAAGSSSAVATSAAAAAAAAAGSQSGAAASAVAAAAAAAAAGADLDPLGVGAGAVAAAGPGSSKSRQKKFHNHFKTVRPEEHVLNYYSCALVGDILLQGHLYITKNYFAFYSNVFGYVTKLLIPTVSVVEVTKEKTARIIPNAIGVATGMEKHVFGSLLSRDSTFKLMVRVWKEAVAQGPPAQVPPVQVIKTEGDSVSGDIQLPENEDSSMSGSEHSCPPTPIDCPTDISHSEVGEGDPMPVVAAGGKLPNGATRLPARKSASAGGAGGALAALSAWPPRPVHILLLSTALLVMLFLSAAFLLYRIGRVQTQFAATEHPLSLSGSDDIYQEILKWQTQLHSRSANEVQEFLNTNLNQLAKVRQSLEALSLLIVTEEQHLQRQQRLQKEAEAASKQHQHYQQHHHHHQQQQGAPSLPHDRLS